MAWRRVGDKPLSEPMMFSLLTHINASLGPNELNTTTKLFIIIVSRHLRVKFTRNRHPRAKANAHVAQRVNITTGDPLHSRAVCTQPCNVNTHSRAHCSPGARLCEQWEHGCVNNGARLCASARLCRGSPVITQLRGFKAIASSWHNYWGPGLKSKMGLYIRPNNVSGRLIFSYPCHCATTYRSRTNRPTGCQQMVGRLVE